MGISRTLSSRSSGYNALPRAGRRGSSTSEALRHSTLLGIGWPMGRCGTNGSTAQVGGGFERLEHLSAGYRMPTGAVQQFVRRHGVMHGGERRTCRPSS